MSEETIFDPKEVKNEPVSNEAMKKNETVVDSEQQLTQDDVLKKKKDLKTASVAGAAGIAGAGLGLLIPKLVFPNPVEEGTEEELSQMDEGTDEVETPESPVHLTGHDMDVASGVDDSMSFSQAFAAARHEVGPGGLFEWRGNTYGTYYANEWNAMSADDKAQYWADVNHSTAQLNSEPEPDPTLNPIPGDDQLADGQEHQNQEGKDGKDNQDENQTEPEPGEGIASNGEGSGEAIENPEPPVEPGEGIASNGEGSGEPIENPEPPVEPGEGIAGSGEGPGEPIENPEPPVEPGEGIVGNGEGPELPIEDPDIPEVPVDGIAGNGEDIPIIEEPEPLFLSDEDVIAEFDLDDDGIADTGFVDANGNEIADVVLDTTGDGSYDTLVIDPVVDEDGELVIADENIVEIGGVEIENDPNLAFETDDLNTEDGNMDFGVSEDPAFDETYSENPDVDDFASLTPDPDATIDNNMDMSDFA